MWVVVVVVRGLVLRRRKEGTEGGETREKERERERERGEKKGCGRRRQSGGKGREETFPALTKLFRHSPHCPFSLPHCLHSSRKSRKEYLKSHRPKEHSRVQQTLQRCLGETRVWPERLEVAEMRQQPRRRERSAVPSVLEKLA